MPLWPTGVLLAGFRSMAAGWTLKHGGCGSDDGDDDDDRTIGHTGDAARI